MNGLRGGHWNLRGLVVIGPLSSSRGRGSSSRRPFSSGFGRGSSSRGPISSGRGRGSSFPRRGSSRRGRISPGSRPGSSFPGRGSSGRRPLSSFTGRGMSGIGRGSARRRRGLEIPVPISSVEGRMKQVPRRRLEIPRRGIEAPRPRRVIPRRRIASHDRRLQAADRWRTSSAGSVLLRGVAQVFDRRCPRCKEGRQIVHRLRRGSTPLRSDSPRFRCGWTKGSHVRRSTSCSPPLALAPLKNTLVATGRGSRRCTTSWMPSRHPPSCSSIAPWPSRWPKDRRPD
jgi:hypothetical protein